MTQKRTHKIGIRLFTLGITLLLFFTLSACGGNTNHRQTDTSTSTNNKDTVKKTMNPDLEFAKLEKKFDTQLGVYVIDTNTKQTIQYGQDKRFAYSSTFKPLAAAFLLKQNNLDELAKKVTYTKDDLVPYSPITEKHVDTGMTMLKISEAAIRKSDNTAGNLLLKAIGGPNKFKRGLRDIGDNITNPARFETELNKFTPGNDRDTTTPKRMAANLEKVLLSDFLTEIKQTLLVDWMTGNVTGDTLIRAGVPKTWKVIDKSGAGTYGTRNDVAIAWPPNKKPIVIIIMSRHDEANAEYDDALIAEAARVIVNSLP